MSERVSTRTVKVCDLCNREEDGTGPMSEVAVYDWNTKETGFVERMERHICPACKDELLKLWGAYCR